MKNQPKINKIYKTQRTLDKKCNEVELAAGLAVQLIRHELKGTPPFGSIFVLFDGF